MPMGPPIGDLLRSDGCAGGLRSGSGCVGKKDVISGKAAISAEFGVPGGRSGTLAFLDRGTKADEESPLGLDFEGLRIRFALADETLFEDEDAGRPITLDCPLAAEFDSPRLCPDSNVDTEPCELVARLLSAILFSNASGCFLSFLASFAASLAQSGSPSHFELTFGTSGGSLRSVTPGSPTAVLRPLLSCACFRCASANWSKASADGSLRESKFMSPPILLFFFAAPLTVELWESRLARLRWVNAAPLALLLPLLRVRGP